MKFFLQNKMIKNGIFMMVFYQLVMISIFMYGYSAVPKNMPELTIAIVNEDAETGQKLVEELQTQLPFHINTDLSYEAAKTELNNRDVHMVVHIPSDFSQTLSEQGVKAELDFIINQSNPATIGTSMQTIANQIATQISGSIQSQSFEGMLQGMQVPSDQAAQMVDGIMTKIESNIVNTNVPPAGMHNQMAPMFLAMACMTGAMIYSMMSVSALNDLKPKLGRWKAFLALQGTNAAVSVAAPLVGVSIYFLIQGYDFAAFFEMWSVQAIEMYAAIQFTSVFCLLLGQAGMIVNMPLLLMQTIASGSVMPQDMMPGLFKFMSHISPMFYTVQLNNNILFGGGKSFVYLGGLLLVGLGALIINISIHAFKRSKDQSDEQLTEKQYEGNSEQTAQPLTI